MNQSDALAREKVEKALESPNNEQEEKILQITRILLDQYSYVEYQTYPRPSHPEIEKRTDVYFTMVAILISLRTTLENEMVAVRSFMERFHTPEEVMQASIEDIAETIQVAGMPIKKATAISKATKYVLEVLNGNWDQFKGMDIDDARDQIMLIPGIGPKAADCILELGLDLPTIVIDVNMLRVISRIFGTSWAEKPDLSNSDQMEASKRLIEDFLRKDGFIYQIVHTMMLLHGKNVCKSNPQCSRCILRSRCLYYQGNDRPRTQEMPLFEA